MDHRDRRPVRKENPVREWISDNLRYIMLFGAIAIIAVAVIFGIRAIAGHREEAEEVLQNSQSAEPTETVEPTERPKATETPKPTETPEPTETPKPTETPEPTEEAQGLSQENQPVQDLVASYYSALTNRNGDALTGLVDQLTDADRAAVENNQLIESYSNVQTYTYPGTEDNSYIVFASYDYKYTDYEEELPALTQFYVYPDEGGNLQLAAEITDSSVQEHIQQVLAEPEVQALIGQVQAEYDAVLSSNPELQSYVASLGN